MSIFKFIKRISHSTPPKPVESSLEERMSVKSDESLSEPSSPLSVKSEKSHSSSSFQSALSSQSGSSANITPPCDLPNQKKIPANQILSWKSTNSVDSTKHLSKALKSSSSAQSTFRKPKWFWRKSSTIASGNGTSNDEATLSKNNKHKKSFSEEDQILCKICLQNFPLSETHSLKGCHCVFCKECLRIYVKLKIKEKNPIVSCPQRSCQLDGHVSSEDVGILMNSKYFMKFSDLQEELEVSKDPSRVWCPIPDCGSLVDLEESLVDGQQTLCPTCKKYFCATCSTPWNNEHKCLDEISELSDLVKRCPKCCIPIERNSGCAQISCQKCQHAFCWYCLQSIEHDYLLLHYGHGSCRGKLGHSRAALWSLRVAIVFGVIVTGAMAVVWIPLLFVTVGPCYICSQKGTSKRSKK